METFIEWIEKNKEYDFSNSPNYFKYFSNTLIDNIFGYKKIRFTQPNQLNDPLEFNPIITTGLEEEEENTIYKVGNVVMPSIKRWYQIRFVYSQINKYGVLSLTKSPQLFSMWNYYANGHKGFLLEFKQDFNEHDKFKSKSNEVYPIKKVEYVPVFELNLPDIVDKTSNTLKGDEIADILFYNKTNRWTDEKEYRLVRDLSDLQINEDDKKVYLGELPFEVIKSVTFGACMSINDKQKIIDNLSETDIEIHQAVTFQDIIGEDERIGKVSILNGNSPQEKEGFLSNNIWTFEGKRLSRNFLPDKRKAKKFLLEELPYYKGYEKEVSDWYNGLKNTYRDEYNE